MRHLLFIGLLAAPILVSAQKTKDHTAVVAELARQISNASFPKSPTRLAVVTFVPVQSNANAANTFGDYLTESIIGQLSANTNSIRLFERKRVDAILKENEFMLSGMMKASEAIKIGELLPIDALFSGTYTKLKNYIDVTGRLIDVVSGEIIMTYTGRIRLTKNIRTLFPEPSGIDAKPSSAVAGVSPGKNLPETKETRADIESRCKAQTTAFQEKLRDLSTPDKVDALVKEAMKTPFENTCGALHYHFINALSRYNLYPADYRRFLLSTLDTISYPPGDDRAYSALSYLTKQKEVPDDLWATGLSIASKVGDYTLSSYLGFLFNRVDVPDTATIQKRADQYFDLLTKERIGLPRAISYDRGFYEMMEALSANQALRMYVYGRYSEPLPTEPDNSVGLHLMYLKRMYGDETDPARKTIIIRWIGAYFNKHINRKSGDQLYDLARDFLPYPNHENVQFRMDQNKEAARKFAPGDLAVLVGLCRDKFAKYATETPYASQREDRINFCVRNGSPIAGIIPTLQESGKILEGGSIDEQLRVMKLLIQMGDQTALLEKTFVSLLGRRSLEDKTALQEVQTLALQVLGEIRTRDAQAIDYMVASLKNYDKAAEVSAEALVSIGKPAVSSLIEQLDATTIHDGGLQYKLVVILGKIGKDAKSAAPSLRKLLATTSNNDIRYATEAALQVFGN